MMSRVVFTLMLGLIAAPQQTPAPPTQTQTQTPAQCLADVRAYVTKRTAELRPLTSETATKLTAERTEMTRACAAKFDVKTVAEKDLSSLADIYSDLNMPDLANAAVTRALASKTLGETERATLLMQSVRLMMREPKGDERNARIEKIVDQLDTMSPAALEQKIGAHLSMNGYYRGDDIDAGIVKHSTWLIATGKALSPELRKKYGVQIVSAYLNMAEAWAGQGKNDEAVALLKRAPLEWADVPNVSVRIASTLDRYLLVGTPGAAITAPRFLNAPAATTRIDMKDHVTLLEFTAHWCGPCKESYPGINRLRSRFESQGFRVVMATQIYGYFQAEGHLDAAAEIDRDRGYFADHHLNVPVAIADRATASVPEPNETAYKVGGIPQIQLIDRQGRIRLIMVGYDDANEAGLAKFIEKLLKEK